ncbi:MAG: helix-turn-helix domain-containing protein [Microthrixaceae bacterium]
MSEPTVQERARIHTALGDPARLAIVDELTLSDRAPIELREMLDIPGNLLAHHLDVLEEAGLIGRTRSSGDGRRRYVHLIPAALNGLAPHQRVEVGPAVFVCTANSARSQLAAVLWQELVHEPASSAGTHPALRVNPGAVAAAKRAGLDLSFAKPQLLDDAARRRGLVVTVCDRAHEELGEHPDWLHWSIPDPVQMNTRTAFDGVVAELRERINSFVTAAA